MSALKVKDLEIGELSKLEINKLVMSMIIESRLPYSVHNDGAHVVVQGNRYRVNIYPRVGSWRFRTQRVTEPDSRTLVDIFINISKVLNIIHR